MLSFSFFSRFVPPLTEWIKSVPKKCCWENNSLHKSLMGTIQENQDFCSNWAFISNLFRGNFQTVLKRCRGSKLTVQINARWESSQLFQNLMILFEQVLSQSWVQLGLTEIWLNKPWCSNRESFSNVVQRSFVSNSTYSCMSSIYYHFRMINNV